jgi:hypothetical protein
LAKRSLLGFHLLEWFVGNEYWWARTTAEDLRRRFGDGRLTATVRVSLNHDESACFKHRVEINRYNCCIGD